LDYNEQKLFLNVDDPTLEWRWNSASELLFDENDSNPRRVRQFLRNYPGLLRTAGVRKISHVSVPDNLLGEDSYEAQSAQLRSKFDEMRKADKLTDVTFIAKNGAELMAHRAFLAAKIQHFETCFSNGRRESGILGTDARIPLDKSRECIEAVLDWIYTGLYDLPTDATERLDVLEEMYRLVRHWDFVESDLFNGLTRELIRSIGTLTYGNLRRLAEDLNLEDGVLAQKCEEFERMNRAVLAGNR